MSSDNYQSHSQTYPQTYLNPAGDSIRENSKELERNIDWKEGLAIALCVPLLILTSIGYFTGYVWAFSIIICLTTLLGFFQNLAFGELSPVFPKASGFPGYAQTVFGSNSDKRNHGKFKFGKLIGGFSAWSYWFGWSSVLAILVILIKNYLQGLIPALAVIPETLLSLLIAGFIFGTLAVINSKGLKKGARIGYLLSLVSLIPLIAITLALFLTNFTLGSVGASLSIILLIGIMLLIIQIAFISSARSIYSMSIQGNLPGFLSKLNSYGHPVNAMTADALFNICLILLGSPTAILAASAIGYICANGISLYMYFKIRNDPELSKLDRSFEVPRGWENVALATAILNIPFFLVGIIYLNSLEFGWATTGKELFMLCLYIPLWFYSQKETKKRSEAKERMTAEKSAMSGEIPV